LQIWLLTCISCLVIVQIATHMVWVGSVFEVSLVDLLVTWWKLLGEFNFKTTNLASWEFSFVLYVFNYCSNVRWMWIHKIKFILTGLCFWQHDLSNWSFYNLIPLGSNPNTCMGTGILSWAKFAMEWFACYACVTKS